MLGPRHLPSAIQLLNHEHDLYMHQKKLDSIVREDRKKRSFVDKDVLAKSKLFEVRERNIKFHNTEKNMAIEKENELLLGKLVEIQRKKKSVLFGAKSEQVLPRTLNGPSRRREKDRIALENEAFARRLLSQQPCFNRKKLENDYEKHNSRVKNMQRLLASSPKRIKLPPLKSTEPEVRMTTSGNNSRDNEKKKKNSKRNNHIAETEEEHVDEQDRKTNQAQERKAVEEKSPESQKGAEENTPKQDTNQPESSTSHVTDSAKIQDEQASPKTEDKAKEVDDKVPESATSQPDDKSGSPTAGGAENEVVKDETSDKAQEQL